MHLYTGITANIWYQLSCWCPSKNCWIMWLSNLLSLSVCYVGRTN